MINKLIRIASCKEYWHCKDIDNIVNVSNKNPEEMIKEIKLKCNSCDANTTVHNSLNS